MFQVVEELSWGLLLPQFGSIAMLEFGFAALLFGPSFLLPVYSHVSSPFPEATTPSVLLLSWAAVVSYQLPRFASVSCAIRLGARVKGALLRQDNIYSV